MIPMTPLDETTPLRPLILLQRLIAQNQIPPEIRKSMLHERAAKPKKEKCPANRRRI